jgi:hypothetical protein
VPPRLATTDLFTSLRYARARHRFFAGIVYCRRFTFRPAGQCAQRGHSPLKGCVCITRSSPYPWVCRRLSPLSASTGSTHCNPARSRP